MTSIPEMPQLPDHFKFRPLELTDYKHYVELLSQLTTVGDMDESCFQAVFNEYSTHKD